MIRLYCFVLMISFFGMAGSAYAWEEPENSPVEAEVDIDDVATESIFKELSCKRAPNALPIVAYFTKKRFIRSKEMSSGSGISCWHFSNAFDLDGLPVKGMCAETENALVRALWPDMFYLPKRTPPKNFLSVTTDQSVETVRAWAARHNLGAATIRESYWSKGLMEVECNSMRLK